MSILSQIKLVDPAYIALSDDDQRSQQRKLAFWIGIMAIGLAPSVLWIDGLFTPGCYRKSISAYFYEPRSGPIFVFILAFVSAFMFRYRGENRSDGKLATAAAVFAIVVAVVPTELDVFCTDSGQQVDLRGNITFTLETPSALAIDATFFESVSNGADLLRIDTPQELFASAVELHVGAAILLLIILLYFTAIAFRRKRPDDYVNGGLRWQKRVRNGIYDFCSVLMIVSLTLAGAGFWGIGTDWPLHPIFLGEAGALAGFGIAWLVKGRFWFGWLDSA